MFVSEARNTYSYAADGTKLQVVKKYSSLYNTSPIIGSAVNTSNLDVTETTDYVGNLIFENDVLDRILVDGGYIKDGVYYFYETDHLGDNRVVVNQSGTVTERDDYYPYGMQMAHNELTNSASGTDNKYKYNGKELDVMHGLNLYDYAARMQDPTLGRFTTVDPLAEKYYSISPYAYCADNPIRLIDPTGMDPTTKEAALIAEDVYGETNEDLNGWRRVDSNIKGVVYQDEKSGYSAGLYMRENKDGHTEYVFATQGTDTKSWKDWKNNFEQAVGMSKQYEINANNAEALQKHFGSKTDLTFVGHSLGGGLAAESSLITNHPAITFNAAGLSIATKAEISSSFKDFAKNMYTSRFRNINAYIVSGEILNSASNQISLGANGKKHYIDVSFFSWYNFDPTGISRHSMGAVKNALDNERIK